MRDRTSVGTGHGQKTDLVQTTMATAERMNTRTHTITPHTRTSRDGKGGAQGRAGVPSGQRRYQ